jgi:hypothetical protein
MQMTFVYLNAFVSQWNRFGLGDDDLRAMERQLLEAPPSGAVMAGTGGLRKVRFSPPW